MRVFWRPDGLDPPWRDLEIRYRLERQQWIGRSRDEVFDFFSDASNLDALTPGWLRLRVLTPRPLEMRSEARLDYALRLMAVPFRWRTRIALWDPPDRFVDVQERGPYALWEHHHFFHPLEDGVLMRDVVHYALPLGRLGRLVHAIAVRSAVTAIFDYRYDRICERMPGPGT